MLIFTVKHSIFFYLALLYLPHTGKIALIRFCFTSVNIFASLLLRPTMVHTKKTWKDDGMNSLEYKFVARKKYRLYTNITVDIGGVPMLPAPGETKGTKA